MDTSKLLVGVAILAIIFAVLGFFLSSQIISQFDIPTSGAAYQGTLEPGEYFIDAKCTSSSVSSLIGRSGMLTLDVLSNTVRIGQFKKGIALPKTKDIRTTTTSETNFATVNIAERGDYRIATNYDGDAGVVSNCQLALSKSTPFMGIKRTEWFVAVIAVVMLLVAYTLLYLLRGRIGRSRELSRQLVEFGEPVTTIRERRDWTALIKWSAFFSIVFFGIILATFAAIILIALNANTNFVMNAVLLMFPLAFALLLLGAYVKIVEYRLYKDKLVYHTHLLVHGGTVIPYKNIISASPDTKNNAIKIAYRDEDGDKETLEIKSGKERINDDCRQLNELVDKYKTSG
jgi:hypothetical protein